MLLLVLVLLFVLLLFSLLFLVLFFFRSFFAPERGARCPRCFYPPPPLGELDGEPARDPRRLRGVPERVLLAPRPPGGVRKVRDFCDDQLHGGADRVLAGPDAVGRRGHSSGLFVGGDVDGNAGATCCTTMFF